MKYQCIIAEDNAVERDLLASLLRKVDEIEIVGIFGNGLEALQYLRQHTVDIAFTDVDMPELTGIGLLQSLREPPVFIFISAHSKYAANGYDLDVLDFITKPLRPERLYRAVGKVLEHLKSRKKTTAAEAEDIFMARTSEGIYKLALGDIAYAESKANYSLLHLLSGNSVMVLIGMKQLEEQLPPDRFVRVHKAYLVNWRLAERIGKETITLAGKYEVPIGDSHRKSLAERIAAYPALERRKDW